MGAKPKTEELVKLAAIAIKDLKLKNDELTEHYEKLALANKVAFNLFNQGNLAAEDLEVYIKAALDKTVEELTLIKEASAFSNENLNTFSVSDKNAYNDEDANLVEWLLND